MDKETAHKPNQLYHSTTKIWDTPVIKPFSVKGSLLTGSQSTHTLVFASSNLQQAFAYALKTKDLELYGVFNGVSMLGFNHVADYEHFKKNHPVGWIHKVDSQTFRLVERTGEWVSSEEVAFDIHESIRVDSIDQAMERKIQIFSNTKKMSPNDWHEARVALQGENYRTKTLSHLEVELISLKMNKMLLDAGKRNHLNEQSGIGFVDLGQLIENLEKISAPKI